MALCYARRMRSGAGGAGGLAPRVLCLTGCPDPAAQYISVMNCLFSAQRTGVMVDGCVLGSSDSAFLQQAAHLTGGLYLRPPRLEVTTRTKATPYNSAFLQKAAHLTKGALLAPPAPSEVTTRTKAPPVKSPFAVVGLEGDSKGGG